MLTERGNRLGLEEAKEDGGLDGEAEGPLEPGRSNRVVLFASFSRSNSWFCDLSMEAAAAVAFTVTLWVTFPADENAVDDLEVL